MSTTVSVEELLRAINTLEEALDFAKANENNKVQFQIIRDACIQRFEYCIELSWKVALKKLGSATKFPKQAIREMARADLIESAELWLDFVEARNESSHSYDEPTAIKVYNQILLFRVEVKKLLTKLENLP